MEEQKKRALMDAAIAVRKNAYAPYSNFQVGAAVLLEDGQTIITGCNVENVSYGLCICAERSAACQAIAMGKRFTAVAVAATPIATPCGACRQFLAEFPELETVICCDAENSNQITTYTIDELLPSKFSDF